MCDYSLMSVPNRLAVDGEELTIRRFPSGSLGFASCKDVNRRAEAQKQRSFWARIKEAFSSREACPIPAVCIPPGARLLLHDLEIRLRQKHQLRAEEEVRFVQVTADPYAYRDAVCFDSGIRIRLQELPPGQRATVVDLAGTEAVTLWSEPEAVLTGRAL
jgi:hypothetical protein